MRALIHKLFQDEFVIDEKPALTFTRERPVEMGDAEGAEDLLSSITHLLKEHDRLSDLTEELKALDKQDGGDDPMKDFAQKILPFLDSFERILYLARNHGVPDEIANWLKSVEVVYFRITDLLESYGLQQMKTIGHTVDLDYHEVVEMVDAPDRPGGTVIAERKKGYIYKGKILRVASVVVAQD